MASMITKLTGSALAASCPLTVSGSAELRSGVVSVIPNERPTKALVVAEAAPSAVYVDMSSGAGLQQQAWASSGFASGTTVVATRAIATKQHQKMRAFRGLEPWKDPT